MTGTIGIAVLASLAVCRLGGVVLRAAGSLLAVLAAVGLVVNGDPVGLVPLLLSGMLWHLGRLHRAVRRRL